MTVSYTADVANASRFGCFTTILLRWKGSVYKLVFKELTAFIVVYFILNIFYRTVLCGNDGWEFYRHLFESLKAYCSIQMSSIPMTFVLGFYVSLIVKRWWDQYSLLPWPDSLAIFIVGLLHGLDERGRLMRRNIMRYVMLAYVITLRRVSFRVRKRFPTIDHVIEAGLMRSDELKCMEQLHEKCTVSKWWMPLVWATNIVDRARQEQRIKSDPGMQTILQEISAIRKGLTGVQHYDTISVPLVYTQVVTLAVYSYFLAALMGAQWVEPESPMDYQLTYKLPTFSNRTSSTSSLPIYQALDLYYPFFLTLQFAFYVGWLKVAETLINPFGEDDDDFELNYLIDRHVRVSYMIVDDMHHNYPELLKDVYWNQTVPAVLPYTQETAHYRKDEPKGSAEKKEEEETYYSTSLANGGAVASVRSGTPNTHYSLFRNRLGGSKQALDTEPYSDYESVDTTLIGWWKARLRKSQMRRSVRSMSSNASMATSTGSKFINHQQSAPPDIPSPRQNVKRKSTSQRGIYARLMSVASGAGRPRRTSVSGVTAYDSKRLVSAEDSIRSSSDLDNDLGMIYSDARTSSGPKKSSGGSVSSIPDLDSTMVADRLRHLSHLTTISENLNSPYSTQHGSRRNSKPYPTAEGIFQDAMQGLVTSAEAKHAAFNNTATITTTMANNISGDSSESPYYPLGSDGSARPLSPRFIIEEVSSNYEPVLVSSTEPDGPAGEGGENEGECLAEHESASAASPALPKRQARMELKALNLSQPVIQVTPPSVHQTPKITRAHLDEGAAADASNDAFEGDEEDEETFEEVTVYDDERNANSAFDHATFYV